MYKYGKICKANTEKFAIEFLSSFHDGQLILFAWALDGHTIFSPMLLENLQNFRFLESFDKVNPTLHLL